MGRNIITLVHCEGMVYHSAFCNQERRIMLLIVGLSIEGQYFPVDVLKQVDRMLATAGFKKEVSSVVKPGQEYAVTYEGPNADKASIEALLKPLAEQNHIKVSVEVEESVRFP